MANEYHLLSFLPKYGVALTGELEAMAQALVASGKLRVAADERRNFVQFRIPQDGISQAFSKRELTDPVLRQGSMDYIASKVEGSSIRDRDYTHRAQASERFSQLLREANQLPNVPVEYEIDLARLLVQATHPVVFKLLLLEKIEVFVSLAHSVGDLLDVRDWVDSRDSGGVQKTTREQTAVFVSAGGNPFAKVEAIAGIDGFPAAARLIVIAGQELGHYSEITRDAQGRYLGRTSLGINGYASDAVVAARNKDTEHLNAMKKSVKHKSVKALAETEHTIAFNQKHKKSNSINRLKRWRAQQNVVRYAGKNKVHYISQFPIRLYQSDALGHNLLLSLEDMAFNLHPQADAYRHEDVRLEETILCMEALARVPQQAVKWGHATTRNAWPNLYRLYYDGVIRNCIAAYEARTGQKFALPVKRRRKR